MAKRSKPIILCDTNVFPKAYHNDLKMLDELDAIGYDRLALSIITLGEIYFAMKKKEVTETKKKLNQFSHVPITKAISKRFLQMMFDYRDYHPSIPDCIIAATALDIDASLFTLNRKHFNFYLPDDLNLYNPIYQHS